METPTGAGAADERNTAGWWAVYTKHQHEKRVAEMMALRGAQIFLPLYRELRDWKGRRAELSLPLFPSYVFVREEPELRVPILSTPGVHMIVTRGSEYAVISAAEVETLQRALNSPRGIAPHPFLQAGERVRIVSGPMEGVEGILLRQKNLHRVVISVEMLAQSAVVEVDEREICAVAATGTRAASELTKTHWRCGREAPPPWMSTHMPDHSRLPLSAQ